MKALLIEHQVNVCFHSHTVVIAYFLVGSGMFRG